jgi:hypothetical protein
MTSNIKQCIALTDHGKGPRCTRNAEKNSDYCWQHEKTVLSSIYETTELPPEISAITSVYSESFLGGNALIQKILFDEHLQILQNWYISQGGKTKWEKIPENQIKYIKQVYENRFPDDSVDPNYVLYLGGIERETPYFNIFQDDNKEYMDLTVAKQRIFFNDDNKNYFDIYLFFSKLHEIHANNFGIMIDVEAILRNGDDGKEITKELKKLMEGKINFENIRDGDIIHYGGMSLYETDPFYIKNTMLIWYDGILYPLNGPDESDHSPTLPLQVSITNFPHSKYFLFSYPSYTLPYKKTGDEKLIDEIKGAKGYGIYKGSNGWNILGLKNSIYSYLNNEKNEVIELAYGGYYYVELENFMKYNYSHLSDDFQIDPMYINVKRDLRSSVIYTDVKDSVIPFLQELQKISSKILVQNSLPKIEEYNNRGDLNHVQKLIDNEEKKDETTNKNVIKEM